MAEFRGALGVEAAGDRIMVGWEGRVWALDIDADEARWLALVALPAAMAALERSQTADPAFQKATGGRGQPITYGTGKKAEK